VWIDADSKKMGVLLSDEDLGVVWSDMEFQKLDVCEAPSTTPILPLFVAMSIP
jgi:hypothetical protein